MNQNEAKTLTAKDEGQGGRAKARTLSPLPEPRRADGTAPPLFKIGAGGKSGSAPASGGKTLLPSLPLPLHIQQLPGDWAHCLLLSARFGEGNKCSFMTREFYET